VYDDNPNELLGALYTPFRMYDREKMDQVKIVLSKHVTQKAVFINGAQLTGDVNMELNHNTHTGLTQITLVINTSNLTVVQEQ
jgi:tellurite resistance-related uncharacterized protein